MKISNKITEQLGRLIAGDLGTAPYLSGPRLVDFYNSCGFDDMYGEGCPSRWVYSTQKIEVSNGTDKLKTILEEFVDPRRYGGDEDTVIAIVDIINQLIKYDGYALTKKGFNYKVASLKGSYIEPEAVLKIGHEYVSEQIEKCQEKIALNDFSGAITNARTLCEAVLIHVIETAEKIEVKNDGKITNLWSRAKKALKLDINKSELPEYISQILTGLDSIITGLAGLSNNAGDRHANKFNTKKHHAKVAVNSAMTLCDFVIDIMVLKTR